MTDKKENILKAALHLFAQQGYAATSTARVAKEAAVSEGLIFRHFENKEGLLKAILALGKTETDHLFAAVLQREEPREVLRGILEIPFQLEEEQYPFWKLLYSLKWQTGNYDSGMSDPIREALIKVFTEMNYANPKAETEIVLMLIDGIATALLLHKPENTYEIAGALLQKYNL